VTAGRSVIVAAARTPVGRFGGTFRDVPAVDLGAAAIRAAIDRASVASAAGDPDALAAQVDYVLMGHVLQAGLGQNTARQAAIAAGLPVHVPAMTINKVCLASLSAIALADQLIRAGEIEVAVAGGMESMSTAPHLLVGCRWGGPVGGARVVDSVIHDGLWSTFTEKHMGQSSDEVNDELGITRQDQDSWAARSHQRAGAAWFTGRFRDEVAGVAGRPQPGPGPLPDEGIRPGATRAQLAGLPPAFNSSGTITAGNASQLSDGAAAVVVMQSARAQALGITPLVEISGHGMSAEQFAYLHTVPATALQRALKKVDRDSGQLDLVEINEAFASVALHSSRLLGTRRVDRQRQRRLGRPRPRPGIDRGADDGNAHPRNAPPPSPRRRRHPLRRRRTGRGTRAPQTGIGPDPVGRRAG
jgi:acetyl-CoA C-acetyltransferase